MFLDRQTELVLPGFGVGGFTFELTSARFVTQTPHINLRSGQVEDEEELVITVD